MRGPHRVKNTWFLGAVLCTLDSSPPFEVMQSSVFRVIRGNSLRPTRAGVSSEQGAVL